MHGFLLDRVAGEGLAMATTFTDAFRQVLLIAGWGG